MPTPLSTESLQFKLALMKTSFSNINPTPNPIYAIPEGNEDSPTFFSPYYQHLFRDGKLPFKTLKDESQVPIPFRTYDHPDFTDWDDKWDAPPIELDPENIPNPSIDHLFHSSLYQLRIDSSYFTNWKYWTITQGTTFTFKGYDHTDVRFVAEWLLWIHKHDAYLKVNARTFDSLNIPYSDPDFPSFILIIPLCLVVMPTPTAELVLHYAIPLNAAEDMDEEEEDHYFCCACKHTF
jgi:hypothetical protein